MKKMIEIKNLSKKYKLYSDSKERLFDLISPKSYGEDFFALTEVNFNAFKGDIIGFIGANGSGKSTLANIIAGIIPHTKGTVNVKGEASLIAVAAGLKGELTGRENIELKCLMLGLNRKQIKELEPSIIEFSELGKFIDQPVKSYSSGMKSRLGFSISVNIDPDILIIDEALSVGDSSFAQKSFKKMLEFKEQGKTMIFVSHSLRQIRDFCDKVLWLEKGMVRKFGPVEEVLPAYEYSLREWRKMSSEEKNQYRKQLKEFQQKLLSNPEDNIDFHFWSRINEQYKKDIISEEYISRIGHIKAGESYIYKKFGDSQRISTNEYKNKVYYIKKQISYKNEIYYLLSTKRSVTEGTIGWIKSKHVRSLNHIHIHSDKKKYIILGIGQGFKHPWGGNKDLNIKDLSKYKNSTFVVQNTEKIGNNIWYKGNLDNEITWIHSKHLR